MFRGPDGTANEPQNRATMAGTPRRRLRGALSSYGGFLNAGASSPHISPLLYYTHRSARRKGATPSSRLDVASATPSPACGPCPPSQRQLDALATNGGEIRGLAMDRNPPAEGGHPRSGVLWPEARRTCDPGGGAIDRGGMHRCCGHSSFPPCSGPLRWRATAHLAYRHGSRARWRDRLQSARRPGQRAHFLGESAGRNGSGSRPAAS